MGFGIGLRAAIIVMGKRQEHRVRKLTVKQALSPDAVLNWFSENALTMDLPGLDEAYGRAKNAIGGSDELIKKLDSVYGTRKKELEGSS